MTISSTIRKAGPYTGNGSVQNFPFAYKLFNAAEVLVVLTTAGVSAVQLLSTHYSVVLNSDQNANPGGTVTMFIPPAVGQTLTLGSQVANLQPTDLTNAGGFYPTVINDGLDRSTIQIQQLTETVGRAISLPFSTGPSVSPILPAPAPNQLLGWNAPATALINVDPASVGSFVVAGAALYAIESVTATAGQTLVNLTRFTYTVGAPGSLTVYLNGLRLRKTADYLETSSTSVTFLVPLVVGDEVDLIGGTEMSTTVSGPAGPTGPTGPQGPAGPTGPQGPAGTGSGTVTNVSVATANGVSGSVANPTTTPAITLTLGAITPTSVNKVAVTAPATGATLTIADGKTLTANSSLTLAGTDGKTLTVNKNLTLDGTDGTTLTMPAATDTIVGRTSTDTLTNKRVTARVGNTASSATPTINTDNVDIYKLTAQAVDITSMTTNLSGTPTDNQCLIIEITGTAARAITWGASFEASTVALPTTTVSTNMLAVAFIWNTATSKWRCVAAV